MAVTSSALSENLDDGDIESGKQRGGAVASMIMGNSMPRIPNPWAKGVA